MPPKNEVQFEEDQFGLFTDPTTGASSPVRRFTWKNSNNILVQVVTYGATITTLKVPDKNGKVEDIVLGFDNMEGYLESSNPYFGATIGRVANRIGGSRITIDDNVYQLSSNSGKNILHGGFKGFDKVNWNHYVQGTKVTLSYASPDGEEGFPGTVVANVTFQLTDTNEFKIEYRATTTKPTYVNLTNHSYFNLAGHGSGASELYKHVVSINADRITEVDDEAIPTAKVPLVANTVFDLQIPKKLGNIINDVPIPTGGFDHNFCINKGTDQDLTFIARVEHPPSGRVLEVYSDQPGVQFYTSNFLPEQTSQKPLIGKGNTNYYKHGAFCLETQNWPDAIHHDHFPKAILYPSEEYRQVCIYRFWIKP